MNATILTMLFIYLIIGFLYGGRQVSRIFDLGREHEIIEQAEIMLICTAFWPVIFAIRLIMSRR